MHDCGMISQCPASGDVAPYVCFEPRPKPRIRADDANDGDGSFCFPAESDCGRVKAGSCATYLPGLARRICEKEGMTKDFILLV